MPAISEKQISNLMKSGYFDPEWYRARYPDVDATGMDPAVHYLRYGCRLNRDPGPAFSARFARAAYRMRPEHEPIARLAWMRRKSDGPVKPDPRWILKAASLVALAGDHARAIDLARAHLPADLAHTAHILQANAAIARADHAAWQDHVNGYLASYGIAPIRLEGSGKLFERLGTAPLPPVSGGPLVSVIMPAWNAEKTVRNAARSILDQTWRNLELLIVDDCSTDATWSVLQGIAAENDRVKILRNTVNVGPYVSKNIALTQARGEWITGHDADDWAHPERLTNHLAAARDRTLDASLSYMIRMQSSGNFGHIGAATGFFLDGAARKAMISCLFKRSILDQKLGYWDSVRFGADSEMIARAEKALGDRFAVLPHLAMICLDLETSLTNHPEHGVDKVKGISPVRANYRDGWSAWLADKATAEPVFLPFPQGSRRYAAADEMAVNDKDIMLNLESIPCEP